MPDDDTVRRRILRRIDIVTLIGEYLPYLPHRSDNRRLLIARAMCPFHDDPDGVLLVNGTTQCYRCHCCGSAGDALDFVAEYERISADEALCLLAERAALHPLGSMPARRDPSLN
jgi:DNA primase